MNRHKIVVLGVVAAAALVAALWSSQTRRPEQDAPGAAELLPALAADINQVSEVRIRTAGDVLQATLKRTEGGWVLSERGDWPVDASLLRAYLLKLAEARRVEGKTDKPALYYKLGVEEISIADHPGAQVELDGLKPPVKLIVGRNVPRGAGHYVRLVGEAQSWQVGSDLAVEKNPANWLVRDLLDIAPSRIERVRVEHAGAAPIEIVRAAPGGAGDFALAVVPRGREPSSDFVADGTAGLLSGLRFDDVSLPGAKPAPAEGVTRALFTGRDGVAIEVVAWKDGDKTWATLQGRLDEEAAKAFAAAEQARVAREHEALVAEAAKTAAPVAEGTPPAAAAPAAKPVPEAPLAVTDAAKDQEQRLAALRAEVEAMNARFAQRSFVLPPYKTSNLDKKLEDYLKPKA